MIDLHNKGCACFKCDEIKDFTLRPGDVLVPCEGYQHEGEVVVRALARYYGDAPGTSKVIVYSQSTIDCHWRNIEKDYNIVSRLRDVPERGLDVWGEATILKRFKLKE